jgi:predicted dehydrogenase
VAERLAVTLEDADRAIAATKAAGVPLQVGFNRRFDNGAMATAELADFVDCVRTGVTPEPTGADARAALAAIESAGSGRPARVATAGRP